MRNLGTVENKALAGKAIARLHRRTYWVSLSITILNLGFSSAGLTLAKTLGRVNL